MMLLICRMNDVQNHPPHHVTPTEWSWPPPPVYSSDVRAKKGIDDSDLLAVGSSIDDDAHSSSKKKVAQSLLPWRRRFVVSFCIGESGFNALNFGARFWT